MCGCLCVGFARSQVVFCSERVASCCCAQGVTSVAISHDGSTIVSGSEDKTLRVWDAASGNVRATLEGHSEVRAEAAVWLVFGGGLCKRLF